MSYGRSGFFGRLGSFVVRHGLWIVIGWYLLAGAVNLVFPQIETVVRAQSVATIPADMTSMRALNRMAAVFDEEGTQTSVTIVMSDPAGLGNEQIRRYQSLVSQLNADPNVVTRTQALLLDKKSQDRVLSKDGKAWFLNASLKGTLATPKAQQSFNTVKQIVHRTFDGSSTTAYVTGAAATLGDFVDANQNDILTISIATSLLIVILLLVVYRSIFTAMLPLVVIGLALAVARGVVSGLGLIGFPVSQIAASFMTAVLLGAVTDYCVFIISRYHERLRAGDCPTDAAVYASSAVGPVIFASAATVVAACAVISFGKLKAIGTAGPTCAVAVIVGFVASVTLLPPVLVLAARFGAGMARHELTARYWSRVGVTVARRPVVIVVTSLIFLGVLASATMFIRVSYDDRRSQKPSNESNTGYRLLDRHFPKDFIFPLMLMVESPNDMRNAEALAELDQMAQRISQLPDISNVSGITRPTGAKLDLATLAGQNGIMGDRLSAASSEISDNRDQLRLLADGAGQLASGLSRLHDGLEKSRPQLVIIASELSKYEDTIAQLDRLGKLLIENSNWRSIFEQIDSMGVSLERSIQRAGTTIDQLRSLSEFLVNTGVCETHPECVLVQTSLDSLVDLRDHGFFDGLVKLRDTLQAATGKSSLPDVADSLSRDFSNLPKFLDSSSSGLASILQRFDTLEKGIGALSDGAVRIADGVRLLVNKNLEMARGLQTIASVLSTMSHDAATPAMSGFYLPPNAFGDGDFMAGAKFFVSKDGRVVRYIIQTRCDPYSRSAVDLVHLIQTVAQQALPNTTLAGASTSIIGYAAVIGELQQIYVEDFVRIVALTIIIVAAILALLLRAVLAPIYLVASVTLSYLSALGLGVVVFQVLLDNPIYWVVPALSFIVLIAVGADYNMLLISRLREESINNTRVGVIRAVKRTGAVITSAGIIFAACMFGLMAGSVSTVMQTGFVIGCGLLLDTFIVRTLTVPALATILGKANWWPSRK